MDEESPYSLDSREQVLENPRNDAPVSVVRATVNHGAERAPHGVCLPGATLEASDTYKHQQQEPRSKEHDTDCLD